MRRIGVFAVVVLLAATACGRSTPTPAAKPTNVSVFAAASLTGAFTSLGKEFHAAHTDVNVTFNFAASSTLARQIADGNTEDVFASADDENMHKLTAAHLVLSPVVFARNTLAIAVSKDNARGVRSVGDLGKPGLTVVLCASSVPCGRFADQILAKAGVAVRAPSREDNVKAVLTKVSLGEADAGIVYASDVHTAPATVRGVTIPASQNVIATYPIAVLRASANKDAAQAFVAFVSSAAGRAQLERYGFVAP